MKLEDAIGLVKGGGCVLFTGAGFSRLAKNQLGEFIPTAKGFARTIASRVGVDSDYSLELICDYAMRDARPEGLGEHGLLQEIISTFSPSTISPLQENVARLPWRRVYTTNYDNIFEISAKKFGNEWASITTDGPANASKNRCIHLNGHTSNLTLENLRRQFKLTHTSYASSVFAETEWASQFRSDIGVAPAVMFIGYSMADLDIARVLFQAPHIRDKVFFIVAADASEVERSVLDNYGVVCAIGIEGFVELCQRIEAPPPTTEHVYSWLAPLKKTEGAARPSDKNTIELLTLGDLKDEFLLSSQVDSTVRYSVNRNALDDISSEISAGKRWFIVHSSLGNGKTVLESQVALHFSNIGHDVFLDSDYESSMSGDVLQLSKTNKPTIVLVDESYYKLDAIQALRAADNGFNVFIIFVRSALFNLDRERYDAALPENYRSIDLNRLNQDETRDLRAILDDLGLWGARASDAYVKKEEYIQISCQGEIANVILSVFENTEIGDRLTKVAQRVLEGKSDIGRFIVLAFLLENANIRPTLSIMSEILNKDAWALTRSKEFSSVGEFLYVRNNEIATRSSIVARFLLRSALKAELILDYIGEFLVRLDSLKRADRRIDSLFKEFQRFSFLEGLVDSPRRRELLIGFYQKIRTIPGCTRNPLFWLQYAIARLSFEQFAEAEVYFKTAYSYAGDGQNWYFRDIDNHYSRLLLESRTKSEEYDDYYDAFKQAHDKLYSQMIKGDNRHYPYDRAKLYVPFIIARRGKFSAEQLRLFSAACRQILRNLEIVGEELSKNPRVVECRAAMERAIEIAGMPIGKAI